VGVRKTQEIHHEGEIEPSVRGAKGIEYTISSLFLSSFFALFAFAVFYNSNVLDVTVY
jgi:hypothetical protein